MSTQTVHPTYRSTVKYLEVVHSSPTLVKEVDNNLFQSTDKYSLRLLLQSFLSQRRLLKLSNRLARDSVSVCPTSIYL